MNPLAWMQGMANTYLGNATSRRDFRVQLRGNRSVLLFGIYLLVLILVGMFVYWQTAGDERITVVVAQTRLQDFYRVVMILLGSMIVLVAPALTATTVVMEKQRKSLDLVFSAPVAPKYFLVGKMIASYRYTWMLLVLSLPVTAACVVLGGASWSDVLVAYVLLSFHALLFTAIGLLMSTVAQKPVSAIVWSYALTAAYLIFASPFGAMTMVPFGVVSREMNFMVAMSPFFVQGAADTYTIIRTTEVPNWIIASLTILLVVKLALLTAGSILSPYGGKELPSLRIHALVYTFILTLYICYAVASSALSALRMTGGGGASASSVDQSVILGIALCWFLSPLFIFIPLMSCFGLDAERRFWPNGAFKLRAIFNGTPAGALPFLLALIGVAATGAAIGGNMATGFIPKAPYFAYVLFSVGFWSFFWSIGRLTSSFFYGLRSARTLQFAAFIVLVVLPVPFLSAIASSSGYSNPNANSVWEFYVLRPLFASTPDRVLQALSYGVIMLILAFTIARVAESKVAKRLAARRQTDERSFATA